MSGDHWGYVPQDMRYNVISVFLLDKDVYKIKSHSYFSFFNCLLNAQITILKISTILVYGHYENLRTYQGAKIKRRRRPFRLPPKKTTLIRPKYAPECVI